MRKEIIFVISDGYEDAQGAYAACAVSSWTGREYVVKTAAAARRPIESAGGFVAYPNYAISEIPPTCAGIVLIGSPLWLENTAEREQAAELARSVKDSDRLVAGIGTGVNLMASSGILNDVYHTGMAPGREDILRGVYIGGHMRQNALAVRDGQIVTARADAPAEFAQMTVSALTDLNRHIVDAWYRAGHHEAGVFAAPRERRAV